MRGVSVTVSGDTGWVKEGGLWKNEALSNVQEQMDQIGVQKDR